MSGVRREYSPFSRVRLELDGVRSGARGSLDQTESGGEVAIVVGAGLGDDVARMAGPDRPRPDAGTQGCRRPSRSRRRAANRSQAQGGVD